MSKVMMINRPTKFVRVVLNEQLCEREGHEFVARLGGTKHLLHLVLPSYVLKTIQDFSNYIRSCFKITTLISLYTSDGFRIPGSANVSMLDEPEVNREVWVCVAPEEALKLSKTVQTQTETVSQCAPINDSLAVRSDAEAESTSNAHVRDEDMNADVDVDSGMSDSGEDEGQTTSTSETLLDDSTTERLISRSGDHNEGLDETDAVNAAATAEGDTESSSKHSLSADLIELDVDKAEGGKRKISTVEGCADESLSKVTKISFDVSLIYDHPPPNPVDVGSSLESTSDVSLESTPNKSSRLFKRPATPRRKSSRIQLNEKRASPIVLSGNKGSSPMNLGGNEDNTMKDARRSLPVPSRHIKLPLTPIRKSMPAMRMKTRASANNDLSSENAPEDVSNVSIESLQILSPIRYERLEKVEASGCSTINTQEMIDALISPDVISEMGLQQNKDEIKLEEGGTEIGSGLGSNIFIDTGSVENGQAETEVSVPRNLSCGGDIQ